MADYARQAYPESKGKRSKSKELSAHSYRTQGLRPAKGEIEVADQARMPSLKEMTPLYCPLVGYKLSLLVSAHVSTCVFLMADRPPIESGLQPVTLTWVHFKMNICGMG